MPANRTKTRPTSPAKSRRTTGAQPRVGLAKLSHTDASGRARMVDVGEKAITARAATAEGCVRVSAELARQIKANQLTKGNLLEVARLAGINAAKRTDELIPLCHSLPVDAIDIDVRLAGPRVVIRATVRTHARTGVEMEALVAVSLAALTVIDMGKAVDRGMVIEGVRVTSKSGGRSGDWSVADSTQRTRR